MQNDNESNIGVRYVSTGNLFIAKNCIKTTCFELGGGRGNISRFSPSAAVRMRRYLRGCMADYKGMLTLTYPGFFSSNGAESKEHLRRFIQELKRECNRSSESEADKQGFSAFWFLEFQERGAPHYHIFTTHVPSKEWVARRWYEIVGSEDIRHLHAGTRTEFLRRGRAGTISYASKYAAKLDQKTVPKEYENVGRFWGVSGRRGVLSADTMVTSKDLGQPHIQSIINYLGSYVKTAVYDGKAEVLKREDGVLIVVINDAAVMRRVRATICRLSAQTMRFSSMFQDAELD